MKNCDKCKYFFCQPKSGTPCAKCIAGEWGSGFKRADIFMRIKILAHRFKLIIKE